MITRRLFGDDAAFDAEFYAHNDARKFAQRRLFMFVAILTYSFFGILDPRIGDDSVALLVNIRTVSVIALSIVWGLFLTAEGYQARERWIMVFCTIAATSVLAMILAARGGAADHYPSAIAAIQIFGVTLVVPQFRTISTISTMTFIAFWSLVGFTHTSVEALSVHAFLLSVTSFAVVVGSYARESLERDQLRKERQLARARDEAMRMGQEAIRANQSKSRMMANVSHELRTPMNAILGFSELMKEEVFGPIAPSQYKSYVQDIHASGRLLLSNIDDLLDMARIEAGKMGWEETTFPVADAMEVAATATRTTLASRNVTIDWIDSSGGASVRADHGRLSQAIINLLNNAGKFSDPGSTVTMEFAASEKGWRLSVADEGCGIPAADLARIREPFAQVRRSDHDAAKGGLGLGLAITSEIMRRLDGEVDIFSVEGWGTTISLTLPAERILLPAEQRMTA